MRTVCMQLPPGRFPPGPDRRGQAAAFSIIRFPPPPVGGRRRQISAGLNSLGVITGAERIPYATFGALTDSQKKEINGAREIRTRAEADPERIFWLVLKEDRSLLYSDGKDITALKDVEKADLHRRGVFYVQNHVLWMYDYNKGKRELVSRDINGKVRELFCENDGGKTNVYLWQEGKKIPDKITL